MLHGLKRQCRLVLHFQALGCMCSKHRVAAKHVTLNKHALSQEACWYRERTAHLFKETTKYTVV